MLEHVFCRALREDSRFRQNCCLPLHDLIARACDSIVSFCQPSYGPVIGHTVATQWPHKGHTRATHGPLYSTEVFGTRLCSLGFIIYGFISSIFGMCENLSKTQWPMCGPCVATVWPLCGHCVATAWPMCSHCVANACSGHGQVRSVYSQVLIQLNHATI